MKNSKNVITSLIAVIIVAGAIWYFMVVQKPNSEFTPITIRGELICLLPRDKKPHMDCVTGLKGEDGNDYGLANNTEKDLFYGLNNGQQVEVSGMLRKETEGEFDVVGTIEMTQVR